jgi:hypothetical protein
MADDSTSISWESEYKLHAADPTCWFFTSSYLGVMQLAWCDFMMDPTVSVHQILEKCDGDLGNDQISVQGRKRELYMGVWMEKSTLKV